MRLRTSIACETGRWKARSGQVRSTSRFWKIERMMTGIVVSVVGASVWRSIAVSATPWAMTALGIMSRAGEIWTTQDRQCV